ncbi:MAG: M42 family metallopeptidase [Caulobacteraceae bacterium]
MIDMQYVLGVLKELCNTASPSGYTKDALKLLEREFKKIGLPVSYTNKGALVSCIEGKNKGIRKVLAAHTDTLGGMVRQIKDNGRISFSNVGGYAGNSIECENCKIHTSDGRLYTGTIYSIKPSVHIHDDVSTLERNLDNMEIVLDAKVFSKEDVSKLGIEVGDFISFDSRFTVTETGFVKSRHLDDKAGVAITLGALKCMKENNIVPKDSIQILITNYEEVGHGACFGVDPDAAEMLCIDMGAPGIGQNSDEYSVSICAKDSGGPYDYEFRTRLVELAKKNNIDYKLDLYPRYGSDASAALKAGASVRAALIGPGIYASHAYERTHSDSIKATAELLVAYMQE